jgi:hypothetical protein
MLFTLTFKIICYSNTSADGNLISTALGAVNFFMGSPPYVIYPNNTIFYQFL